MMISSNDNGSEALKSVDEEIAATSDNDECNKLKEERLKLKEIMEANEYNKRYMRRHAERSTRDLFETFIVALICILLVGYMLWRTFTGGA